MITQNTKFKHCKNTYNTYKDRDIEDLNRGELLYILWALKDIITVVEEAELSPNMNFPKNWGAVLLIDGEYYSRTFEGVGAEWIDEGGDGYTDREIGMLITRNDHEYEAKWGGIRRTHE